MNITRALLADTLPLGSITALGYEYVVAANGLFIRAEDERMEALISVAETATDLPGLESVSPFARLKLPCVPARWLWSVWQDARGQMAREVMYQFVHEADSDWRCVKPEQVGTLTTLGFADGGQAVIDLHSHNTMRAFFSNTDDADESGLRFYAVIGRLDTECPELAARVGVYGQHWNIPVLTVFDGLGPFVDVLEGANGR
jgi:PRTRC genetic system protein A